MRKTFKKQRNLNAKCENYCNQFIRSRNPDPPIKHLMPKVISRYTDVLILTPLFS